MRWMNMTDVETMDDEAAQATTTFELFFSCSVCEWRRAEPANRLSFNQHEPTAFHILRFK